MGKYLVVAVLWGFGGPMKLKKRFEFGEQMHDFAGLSSLPIDMPPRDEVVINYEVLLENQSWALWSDRIANDEIEPKQVSAIE